MPAHRLHRFARPEFFGSIDTVTLGMLLHPFRDYFRARGIDPDVPNDLVDRATLVNLFLDPDDAMPTALLQSVCMLDELAAPIVMDELLAEGLIQPDDAASPAD